MATIRDRNVTPTKRRRRALTPTRIPDALCRLSPNAHVMRRRTARSVLRRHACWCGRAITLICRSANAHTLTALRGSLVAIKVGG
jgi:hypothetical protein